jgi:hypothetical protein
MVLKHQPEHEHQKGSSHWQQSQQHRVIEGSGNKENQKLKTVKLMGKACIYTSVEAIVS